MSNTDVDVLVIGMGPAGLMCALSLAKAGIRTKVIDKRYQYGSTDRPFLATQSSVAPSLGHLVRNTATPMVSSHEPWRCGIPTASSTDSSMHRRLCMRWSALLNHTDIALPSDHRTPLPQVTYNPEIDNGQLKLVRTRPVRNVVVDSRFPYERTAAIEHIEGTLREALLESGGTVQYTTTPTNIEVMPESQSKYPVRVTLESVSGLLDERGCGGDLQQTSSWGTIHAKYLVGADGANSWVRRFFNIPLEGDLTESIWGVTDVIVETNFSDCRMKCIINAPTGTIITIPREGEKIRFYVQLSLDDCQLTHSGRVDKSQLSSEASRRTVLKRIQAGMSPFDFKFTHVFRCTIFAIPQRVAKRYSIQDRVFIVGDACHQHSPKAGQGANAAMGDSHNLAWKLAHVIKGWASTNILRTYEIERKGYAQQLINFDKEISETLEKGSLESYERWVLHRQNEFTSGLGIEYDSTLTIRSSPSQQGGRTITAGKYLPWCPVIRLADWDSMDIQSLISFDGLWRLLVFPGDIRCPNNQSEVSRLEKELARCVGVLKYTTLYTILDNREDDVQWTDVPRILRSWKRVFVSNRKCSPNVYELLGAAQLGAVILVRPDGYVSTVQEISKFNGDELTGFFLGL
ncbi:hypothetical protein CCMSSC00406_0007998 [Pleurotus cornucopiae]|uniref:Uncharacterized protein n=1 Tax=Pleurotus cornucopiae TaxID=5321 RepID=A0ACB7IKM2_PLECO|nr:hypothetical protein CCMSSC00406_0007998 [Pleurotus cornucopiae]